MPNNIYRQYSQMSPIRDGLYWPPVTPLVQTSMYPCPFWWQRRGCRMLSRCWCCSWLTPQGMEYLAHQRVVGLVLWRRLAFLPSRTCYQWGFCVLLHLHVAPHLKTTYVYLDKVASAVSVNHYLTAEETYFGMSVHPWHHIQGVFPWRLCNTQLW